ncbi:c-type cytochrome [Pseudophaeobacter arcticus]|jgi:cytochrome c2|uniref:c-type cytochrome n=1 Tax=Pseudophaeobacter arcticus TaxID=385492 RepID=UPI0039E461F5
MNTSLSIALVAAIGAAAIYALSHDTDEAAPPASAQVAGGPIVSVRTADTFTASAQVGKQIFDAACANCHGQNAAGRNGMGPPLVHKIYEPSHHADAAFMRAVQFGVQAHHWNFGNMPKQGGLTDGDVKSVIHYIRELQRTNGIE